MCPVGWPFNDVIRIETPYVASDDKVINIVVEQLVE
jgi:hypothetical protein